MIISGAAANGYFTVSTSLQGDGTAQAIIDLEEAPYSLDFKRNYPSKVSLNGLFIRIDGDVDTSYTATATISHGVVKVEFNKPLPFRPWPDAGIGGFASFDLSLAYDTK